MDEHESLTSAVVPGRECGGCTICCRALKINVPELKKLAGVLCQHCSENVGCLIYDTRPSVCRGFDCGWKVLRTLGDEWRPDRCGICIVPVGKGKGIPPEFPQAGLKFDVVDSPRVLNWYPLIQFIAQSIERGIPVFLGVPAPVGYERKVVFLNHRMGDAVASRDRMRITEALKSAYEVGLADILNDKATFD